MPRIIEYDERDYSSSGGYGSGAALVVVLILFFLYLGGYFPWLSNLSSSIRASGVTPPAQPGVYRPVAPAVPVVPVASSIGYVTADNLNMRVSPGEYSPVSFILPRGTRVEYLGESYQEPDGDLWLQVRIQTYEGLQVGWVNRRYVS